MFSTWNLLKIDKKFNYIITIGKGYWHMGTSDLSTFRFLKILKPNTSMFRKIMGLNT
jgi:hypothetical protein